MVNFFVTVSFPLHAYTWPLVGLSFALLFLIYTNHDFYLEYFGVGCSLSLILFDTSAHMPYVRLVS